MLEVWLPAVTFPCKPAGSCRIYLEVLHDYQLAEEYCDGLYEEGRNPDSHAMHRLPPSLQAKLQGVGVQDAGTPGASGSDMYLLLIQVISDFACSFVARFAWRQHGVQKNATKRFQFGQAVPPHNKIEADNSSCMCRLHMHLDTMLNHAALDKCDGGCCALESAGLCLLLDSSWLFILARMWRKKQQG